MATGPLPREEYEAVYARVPRLTVELVVVLDGSVLLTLRETGPCRGLWHLPGGTVRYGEPLTTAVARVAQDELGTRVEVEGLLGYIEYPSHLARGIDWPVGVAFGLHLAAGAPDPTVGSPAARWYRELPDEMHDEQRSFLAARGLPSAAAR